MNPEADYSTVTELPGVGAHKQQLAMAYTRYHFASRYAKGKDVLEVACGAGQGLGYLARVAKRVVGGDIDDRCLQHARQHYTDGRAIEIRLVDAQNLPFEDACFDTVILLEAVYYLPDAPRFIREARRVLCPGGVLLIGTVNCEWFGFNPSPFSTRYYSAPELRDMLAGEGFSSRLFVAFPDKPAGLASRVVSAIRKVAVRLHLIPSTMKGKELFKRLFYGKLEPMPSEVTEGMAPLSEIREAMPGEDVSTFKSLFAVGVRAQ